MFFLSIHKLTFSFNLFTTGRFTVVRLNDVATLIIFHHAIISASVKH